MIFDVRYNVIKKRMEIDIPDTDFISDMRDESCLIAIEDRCIQRQIPESKVRDYLKLLAVGVQPCHGLGWNRGHGTARAGYRRS
jgi:hypothetical protein